MTPQEIQNEYTKFFKKSAVGKQFVATLESFIAEHHSRGENAPETARDHAQRAAGIREIVAHINSVSTPRKKETPPKQ